MNTTISRDGSRIAFDILGTGPPVILVGGAFSYRRYPRSVELAELLSERFTVVNYDRRGRGDSSDTAPYAVEREIEDLDALIEMAGGSAYVWGQSSGGVLALRGAVSGLDIKKLAIYEPPFILDSSGAQPPPDFQARLEELLASDRRGEAVKYFMTKGMGAPAFFITMMSLVPPIWSRLKAVAHTLPYDVAIMGETIGGKPLAAQEWAPARAETLVLSGAKTKPQAQQSARSIAEILPNARHQILEGQSYNIKMKPLAPVLEEFFVGDRLAGAPPSHARRSLVATHRG